MATYLQVLNIRPLEYEDIVTQSQLSQIGMIINDNQIAGGLTRNTQGYDDLYKGDIVYIGYSTKYKDIALLNKVVVGESMFSSEENNFYSDISTLFLSASPRYTSLYECEQVLFTSKEFYLNRSVLTQYGLPILIDGNMYNLENNLVQIIENGCNFTTDKKRFSFQFKEKLEQLKNLFLKNEYMISKKGNTYNRKVGNNVKNTNSITFYEMNYGEYAKRLKDDLDVNKQSIKGTRGAKERLNWTLLNPNDDLTSHIYKVHFIDEIRDLDYCFAVEGFQNLVEQNFDEDCYHIGIFDTDLFFTEPLRDGVFNRPLFMSLKNDEEKDHTYYAPDGMIISFNMNTFAIKAKILELKATHCFCPEENEKRMKRYIEQADKYCNVFTGKSNNSGPEYRKREYKYYHSGCSQINSEDYTNCFDLRKMNTVEKYKIIISAFIMNSPEYVSIIKPLLIKKYDVNSDYDIEQRLKSEIQNIFYNNGNLEYLFVIDNSDVEGLIKMKQVVRNHGITPAFYKIERFYERYSRNFSYKFTEI